MKNIIRQELQKENEKVKFIEEDSDFYYYEIEDEFFKGTAKVEKSNNKELEVEFKEKGTKNYRGNGVINLT